MEVFLSRNGQQYGPYSAEWLESFLEEGSVHAEDLAWTAGREGWVPVRVLLAELKGPVPVDQETPASAAPEPAVQSAPKDDSPVLGLDQASTTDQVRPGVDLGKMLRGAAAIVGGIVLLTGLLMLASVPKHATISRNGEHWLRPDDGYTFVDPDDPFKWEVKWTPGKPSLTQAGMLAGSDDGAWVAAPGYELDRPGGQPIWRPGKREDNYPYVIAGETPDTWGTDPGYVLADSASATAPRVVWRAGIRLPHMVSADEEHHWKLDPGYTLVEKTIENPRAAWSPGARHFLYPHISASTTEGSWSADDGYFWVQANDLRTFHLASTVNAWNAASEIDAATSGIDCSTNSILATVEFARDRYAAINTSEVHPLVAQNLGAVREGLSSAANTITTCYVVKSAGDGADLTAGIWCAGRAFLADDDFEECMAKSKVARQVIGAASTIGGVACDDALGNVWRKLNTLAEERQGLQVQFNQTLGVRLPSARYLVTCR